MEEISTVAPPVAHAPRNPKCNLPGATASIVSRSGADLIRALGLGAIHQRNQEVSEFHRARAEQLGAAPQTIRFRKNPALSEDLSRLHKTRLHTLVAQPSLCNLPPISAPIATPQPLPAAGPHERANMPPTHVAKPELVRAEQITNFCTTLNGINIITSERSIDVDRLSESPLPAIGDYLVSGDGFTYVMPKAMFELHFMPLASLIKEPRPGFYHLPPPIEVVRAAELVGRYFADNNYGDWALGPCAARFPRGEGA